MYLKECLPPPRKLAFPFQVNFTSEMGFSKVATGNRILESNERWKEMKISGVLEL